MPKLLNLLTNIVLLAVVLQAATASISKGSSEKVQTDGDEEADEEFAMMMAAYLLENPDLAEPANKDLEEKKKLWDAETEKTLKELEALAKKGGQEEPALERIEGIDLHPLFTVAYDDSPREQISQYSLNPHKKLYYDNLCRFAGTAKPSAKYENQMADFMSQSHTMERVGDSFLTEVSFGPVSFFLDDACNIHTRAMVDLRRAAAEEKGTFKAASGFTLHEGYQLYHDGACNWATPKQAADGVKNLKNGLVPKGAPKKVTVGTNTYNIVPTTLDGIWVDATTCDIFTQEEAVKLGAN